MHNAVHKFPGTFSLLFSAEWTENVIASTEPNSLFVVDNVIPLALPKEEEKSLPNVIRLN